MIFEAFLRWSGTAKAQNRADAASLLGKAVGHTQLDTDKKQVANFAAAYMLDDLSPKVRMALADSLADDVNAPRAIILALTEDQVDIAMNIVSRSPVLRDGDLIDIAGRGSKELRAAVAVRKPLSGPVAAALAEVGRKLDILLLLRNDQAHITPNVLVRLASRFGADAAIRDLLLDRPHLPATARHILIERLGQALTGADLVQAVLPARKIERLRRDACDAALVEALADAHESELVEVADHMRREGRLSTAFLLHALSAGRTTFFSECVANLSGVARARVRSILASGRPRAVRALIEAAGIGRDVSPIFCEAVEIWREQGGELPGSAGIFMDLAERCRARADLGEKAQPLIDFIERLGINKLRKHVNTFAQDFMLEAA